MMRRFVTTVVPLAAIIHNTNRDAHILAIKYGRLHRAQGNRTFHLQRSKWRFCGEPGTQNPDLRV
jgi:hypothetical protein